MADGAFRTRLLKFTFALRYGYEFWLRVGFWRLSQLASDVHVRSLCRS